MCVSTGMHQELRVSTFACSCRPGVEVSPRRAFTFGPEALNPKRSLTVVYARTGRVFLDESCGDTERGATALKKKP